MVKQDNFMVPIQVNLSSAHKSLQRAIAYAKVTKEEVRSPRATHEEKLSTICKKFKAISTIKEMDS